MAIQGTTELQIWTLGPILAIYCFGLGHLHSVQCYEIPTAQCKLSTQLIITQAWFFYTTEGHVSSTNRLTQAMSCFVSGLIQSILTALCIGMIGYYKCKVWSQRPIASVVTYPMISSLKTSLIDFQEREKSGKASWHSLFKANTIFFCFLVPGANFYFRC